MLRQGQDRESARDTYIPVCVGGMGVGRNYNDGEGTWASGEAGAQLCVIRGAGGLRSHGQPHWEEQSACRQEGLQLVENQPIGKTGCGPQAPARNWTPEDAGH